MTVDDTAAAAAVAQELLQFLEAHLLVPLSGKGERLLSTATAETSARALDDLHQPRCAFSVEFYNPALGGMYVLL